MDKYKPLLLVLFILSVGILVFMNTGTRVVQGTPTCANASQTKSKIDYCISVQPEKAYRGRYSEYKALDISLCLVAIFCGGAYIYSNMPKKLIRNSIPKKKP